MPEYAGGIKYPVPDDQYDTTYGEPQWWKDLATTAAAKIDALHEPMVTQISTGIYGVGDRHITTISDGIYQIGA